MKPHPPHVLEERRRPKLPLWLGWLLGAVAISFAACLLGFVTLLCSGCEDHDHGSNATSSAAAADAAADDPLPAGKVVWFGNPNCSKAVRVPLCTIANLRVGKDGLSYKWVSGGCEALGATGAGDYSRTLACMGYQDPNTGVWRFAKFDWVSTSRTTRDFINVNSGYNGWDRAAFAAARSVAFVIVSSDGKRRSNFAFASK